MIRELFMHEGKDAPACCKATQACKTGMGVVVDFDTLSFDFPASATGDNIYVVHKDRKPNAADAAIYADYSDYFDGFNTVAAGELVPLYTYCHGEAFATDAYDTASLTAANKGKRVVVGTDGKWTLATSTATSRYIFTKLHDDAGHTLAWITVADAAAANS